MGGIRYIQNLLPLLKHRLRLSVMHDRRREKSQSRVMMLLIVPGEESLRPRTRIG